MLRKMKDSGVEWLGKVPEGWHFKPLKNCFAISKGLNITKADLVESGVPVVSYGQIHAKRNTGTHLSDDLLRFVPETYLSSDPESILQEDDFVFADTSEDLEGLGNCVFVDRHGPVMAGYHALILRPKIDACYKYLAFLFKTDAWRKQIRQIAYGIKVYSLSQRMLRQCSIVLPPLAEQRAIAAYLDERCAKIDTMIAEAKETIEEYKQWKQSLIFEAVTGKREVESGKLRVESELRDSGVEWLGQVPEGWTLRCLFQQARQVKNRNDNLQEKNLLSLSYGKVKRRSIDAVGGLLPASFEGYNRIEPGDIVLRLTDLQNDQHSLRTGLSKERGIITSAYVTVRPDSSSNSEYLHLALCAFDIAKGFYGMGAGVRQGLTYDDIKLLKLPFPPLPEQRAIAAYLDRKCAAIDRVVAEKEGLIADLEQFKKSLIFECVTGKREVA